MLTSSLDSYSYSVVADFVAFGWPVNYSSASTPTPLKSKHSSANNFPNAISSFLQTELSYGATAGPFLHDPFLTPLQTSPLQTVPKDESKRCVVLDLSFPAGTSVNNGIPKDSFFAEPFHLSLPRSADLRQSHHCCRIPVDPTDYSFLGYCWQSVFYFDTALPFGLRSITLACQRTTNVYHHGCVNYINDFSGAEASHVDASLAFQDLEDLFTSLGLESSLAKDCPPSTRMAFLNLIYDTVTTTFEVPPNKLLRTFELICYWLHSPRTIKSNLQSLLGNFSHIYACISPGRIFMQRFLYQLPNKPRHFSPSPELLTDLHWWQHFLLACHGVSFLRSSPWIDEISHFCTEASLAGIGGFLYGHFFHSTFPPFIAVTSVSIASLEMLAVTVSFKL